MKKKRKAIFEISEKYAGSAEPPCPHFGECGGCSFQDISYENQLQLKKDYLSRLFSDITEVPSVSPSVPFRYRSRMDMVTAFGKIGLRRAGSHRHVIDITSCKIMQEKSEMLYSSARTILAEVEGYDYLRHTGFLRYAVIRQAMFTGETMVNLVVSDRRALPDAVIDGLSAGADSMSVLLNSGKADLSFGEVIEVVRRGFIVESFDGTRYRIGPNSFFQSNSRIALDMYRRIREEASGRALDLYSGVGSISLFVAGKCESVTGVELVEEAVAAAEANRTENGATNVEFTRADAAEYLESGTGGFDTIILDPPRSGLHPKVVERINLSGAARLIYMSCNPDAFRREIDSLDRYGLDSLEAFDMFPQTPHIETLAVLSRRR
ncbi:MAG: 23S rRNA (uracil(1939)-C(5))-methyltransferase RlmD [Spirochaetes bacterium]|jgi:23S rRNA (uracil-5-)-methyltransferase RumA|nr:23S rRNA (uracil(1939)-C(5))-methyltransferase RlmD [Spirochaetota bacterium]